MPDSDDALHDDALARRDQIGGNQVGGDKLTVADIGGSGVAIGAGASASVTAHHHHYPPVVPPLDRQQHRNREAMLAKVRLTWIDSVLNQSLFKEAQTCRVSSRRRGSTRMPCCRS
jgi:hypothetical protein